MFFNENHSAVPTQDLPLYVSQLLGRADAHLRNTGREFLVARESSVLPTKIVYLNEDQSSVQICIA
jgi:hypothetical protein